jgi:hypothetical protein
MTKLCARGKSAAKRKFKVYPSAYANAYASKICAGKIKDPSGTKKKDWGPKKASKGKYFDEQKTNVKGKSKTGPMPSGKTPEIPGEEYLKYKKFRKNKVVSANKGTIMKVANKLEKASKAHAGQAKTLKSLKLSKGGGAAIRGTNFQGVF